LVNHNGLQALKEWRETAIPYFDASLRNERLPSSTLADNAQKVRDFPSFASVFLLALQRSLTSPFRVCHFGCKTHGQVGADCDFTDKFDTVSRQLQCIKFSKTDLNDAVAGTAQDQRRQATFK
jgi:hypothetical protein